MLTMFYLKLDPNQMVRKNPKLTIQSIINQLHIVLSLGISLLCNEIMSQ